MVKSAVFKAYELVPEEYHQHFRGWQKTVKHMWNLHCIWSHILISGALHMVWKVFINSDLVVPEKFSLCLITSQNILINTKPYVRVRLQGWPMNMCWYASSIKVTNPREEIVCPQSLNSGTMEKVIQVCTMIANERVIGKKNVFAKYPMWSHLMWLHLFLIPQLVTQQNWWLHFKCRLSQ